MSNSCENYGTPNGTACACPPGFGGSTCSQPACGGTIFEGASRSLASGQPLANLTSCSCPEGWTGTGCNVCQTAKACQAGFASVEGTVGSLEGADTGQNHTIICNDAPRVYAAGEMSCQVQVSCVLLVWSCETGLRSELFRYLRCVLLFPSHTKETLYQAKIPMGVVFCASQF